MKQKEYPEPYESLFRIQRALAGHVSFLAACETNVVFSEYLLYEPILRVLMARQCEVDCEVSCVANFPKNSKGGDHKRIDFVVVTKNGVRFALEVKWPRKEQRKLNVQADYKKLTTFQEKHSDSKSFLCVFGRFTQIEKLKLEPNFFSMPEILPPIYACFIRTQYGSKIYQLESQHN